MKKQRLPILALVALAIFFASANCFAQEIDLRKPLSEEAYIKFHDLIMKEAEKDPQTTGRQAKQMLIGMLGLETKPDMSAAFDASVGYDVAAVLLLVADNSKIKGSDSAIEQFQKESQMTVRDLKDKPDQAAFIESLTTLLVLQNRNLK